MKSMYLDSIYQTTTLFDRLYDSIALYQSGKDNHISLPKEFRNLSNTLFQYYPWFYMPDFYDDCTKKLPIKISESDVVVCMSNGLKSAATVDYYIGKNYTPRLYHRYFRDSDLCSVREFAKKRGLQLYVDYTPVYRRLQTKFIECFNGAMVYATDNWPDDNFPQICVGSIYNTSMLFNCFATDGCRCVEMWDGVEDVWKARIENFRIPRIFMTFEQMADSLGKDAYDILKQNPIEKLFLCDRYGLELDYSSYAEYLKTCISDYEKSVRVRFLSYYSFYKNVLWYGFEDTRYYKRIEAEDPAGMRKRHSVEGREWYDRIIREEREKALNEKKRKKGIKDIYKNIQKSLDCLLNYS